MKVVCVDSERIISGKNSPLLTIGGQYNVVDEDNDCYYVIDDTNSVRFFRKTRFVLLSEIRNHKLEEILSDAL
jgi:hypothetical protein